MTCRFKTIFSIGIATLAALGLAAAPTRALAAPGDSPRPISTRDSYVPTSDDLFKKLSPGIVKILIRLHGVPVLVGTGFFVSDNGVIMTNRHVMKNVIHEKGYTAEFSLRDKRVFKEFEVGHCSDDKQVDLCLVKLAVKPKIHFKLAASQPGANDPAYIIGHPRGMDFTIAYGVVKGYHPTSLGSEELEITTPMGPGSSGGPLFDSQGDLVGVASKYSSERLNENFGIPHQEVQRFLDEAATYMPLAVAREQFNEYLHETMRTKRETELDPAFAALKAGKSLSDRKDFKDYTFDFGSQIVSVTLPKIFDSCQQMKKQGATDILHACFGYGDMAVFTLQRFSAKSAPALANANGKLLLGSKYLSFVAQLKHDGAWAPIEKKLSASQKNEFYSHPQPAKCSKLSGAKGSAFSDHPSCQFTVMNDTEPAAESYNTWIEQGGNIFSFSIWLGDSNLSEYFSKLPTFAALTAKSSLGQGRALASSLQDKRLDSYKITFPDNFDFIGAKVERDGGHYDLFAARRANGQIEESTQYSVTEDAKTILPPSYDSSAKTMAARSAKISGVAIQESELILGTMDVDGSPARVASGVGKNKKGQDNTVLACVIFGKELTHVMTKVQISKDPSVSFRNFKTLCSSFKRQ
jgi:S1-C subfamily serine protease